MDKQTPTRDKLLLIGTRPSKALRGDIVKVECGQRRGQLIEVRKVMTAIDRHNNKKTIDIIFGTKNEIVPVKYCTFYSLRSESRPEDFKKRPKNAS